MLPITDLNGEKKNLTHIKKLTRKRKVNGEKTLSFHVYPSDSNSEAYGLVDGESIAKFANEEYIIKQVNEKNWGRKTRKEAESVLTFYNDMIGSYQYEVHNGSMTFRNACEFVFGPTDYQFNIVDSFLAEEFENFGDNNCLSLFQRILQRYGAEFRVVGKMVYLHNEIGARTGFQYRYAHNIKVIDKEISTKNLATIIRGYYGEQDEEGNYSDMVEHRSPNINKFGEIIADPIKNEHYKHEPAMLNYLKRVLIDEPQLSITISLADLRAAGYNFHTVNEGDYGYIIYEPMNLKVEARIVEVEEEFIYKNGKWIPVNTQVTISNVREKISSKMTRFAETSRSFHRLLKGQEKIPDTALQEATRIATDALKSAQTELEFNNGIIARNPENPNEVVVYNSAGLGVSRDGGQTFHNAITGQGINAEVGIFGALKGVVIEGAEIYGTEIYQESGNTRLEMKEGRIFSYVGDNQTMIFGGYDLEFFNQQGSPIGKLTPLYNVGDPSIRGLGMEIQQDFFTIGIRDDDPNTSNLVRPTYRASQSERRTFVAGPFVRNVGDDSSTLELFANTYLRGSDSPTSSIDQPSIVMTQGRADNDLRMYFGGYNRRDDAVLEIRHRASQTNSNVRGRFKSDGVDLFGRVGGSSNTGAMLGPDGNAYYENNTGTNRLGELGSLKAAGLRTQSGYTHIYLGTMDGGEVRVTNGLGNNPNGDIGYRDIRVSGVIEASSVIYKSHIQRLEDNFTPKMMSLNPSIYYLNEDLENRIYDKPRIGLFAEEVSPEFRNETGINYTAITVGVLKMSQEQQVKIESLEERVKDLELIIMEA